jgi:23S rRNA (adenine2030-N6)-methyltransferase
MKYRHRFHAGNFADVHKHVTLLALIAALQRKDKGFLFIDTHAGAGQYSLEPQETAEWRGGAGRLWAATPQAPEIRALLTALRAAQHDPEVLAIYPGSPLLAVRALRPQDRAALFEQQPEECDTLEQALRGATRVSVRCADGYHAVRSLLPPIERRGLVLIDPPYESTNDWQDVAAALATATRRFAACTCAAWLPVKHAADLERWWLALPSQLAAPRLLAQLWLQPRDNRAHLTGSALLVVNPPYQVAERMRIWLPELLTVLGGGANAGVNLVAVGDTS